MIGGVVVGIVSNAGVIKGICFVLIINYGGIMLLALEITLSL